MSIVPSGKKRTMVAQSFGNEGLDETSMDNIFSEVLGDEGELSGAELSQEPEDKNIVPEESKTTSDMEQSDDSDLISYISSKLESFGYPPRRLEEFENEFVSEKISSGGIREVTIVIPDRYYGMRKRISNKDFSQTVKEIQEKFELNFIDAERKDKKIIMNFTSQSKEDEDGDNEFTGDILEEVYGRMERGKSKPNKKSACTMIEMLESSKQKLFDKIKTMKEG